MRSRMRLVGVAGLAAVLVTGCGRSHTPDARTTEVTGKVSFYVKDMGQRLNLL